VVDELFKCGMGDLTTDRTMVLDVLSLHGDADVRVPDDELGPVPGRFGVAELKVFLG
jgi:hypothetical protein